MQRFKTEGCEVGVFVDESFHGMTDSETVGKEKETVGKEKETVGKEKEMVRKEKELELERKER